MTFRTLRAWIVIATLGGGLAAVVIAEAPRSGQRQEDERSLFFELHSFKGMNFELSVRNTDVLYRCLPYRSEVLARWSSFTVSKSDSDALFSDLERLGAFSWNEKYIGRALDGEGWSFQAKTGGRVKRSFGSNAQPIELGRVVDRIGEFLGDRPWGFSGVIGPPPENCLTMKGRFRNHLEAREVVE